MALKGLFDNPSGKALGLDDLKDNVSQEELEKMAQGIEPEKNEPVEEPKPEVEPKVEEQPKAEVTPQEEQPQKEAEEPKEEPKQMTAQESLAFFNKTVSKNYSSFDDVKADLEKPTMESEYNEAKTRLEELQKQLESEKETNELLASLTDPRSLFSSEEAMKLEMFKKANPDFDASIAQKIFSSEDLSKIDNLEMVKMGWKANTPGLKGSDKDLEAAIAEELGQDPDTSIDEWSVSAQNRLARMAGQYINQFKDVKKSVSLPEGVNIEEIKSKYQSEKTAKLESLTAGWNRVAEESLKTTKVKVPIGEPKDGEEQAYFQWDLKDVPKEDVDNLRDTYVKLGITPEEGGEQFQEALETSLIAKNLPQIMQKYGDDIEARLKKEFLEKSHNPEPLKDSERTDEGSKDPVKERSEFAREGSTVFAGKRLFNFNT